MTELTWSVKHRIVQTHGQTDRQTVWMRMSCCMLYAFMRSWREVEENDYKSGKPKQTARRQFLTLMKLGAVSRMSIVAHFMGQLTHRLTGMAQMKARYVRKHTHLCEGMKYGT